MINFKDTSTISLIIANLMPIIGVIAFDWSAFLVILLYCVETLIIGIYNILKMATCSADESLGIKFIMIPFFIIHYNMFVLVQIIFVVLFALISDYVPEAGSSAASVDLDQEQINDVAARFIKGIVSFEFVLALIFLFVSHGIAYVKLYLAKHEREKVSISHYMFAPYSRIIIQQLTVIFGGFLTMSLGSPIFMLVLLIALKTYFDLRAHYKEHRVNAKIIASQHE